MAFTPRLTEIGILNNPYWYARNPFYQSNVGLPNCTCYAWGRWWEIADPNVQYINRPNLSLGNAKEWYGYTEDGYERGQVPKLGAVICFAPESGSTRVGHVGVVEAIYSDHITTSNSDYGGEYFYLENLYPNQNGKYTHSIYTSQGFIYNPFADQPIEESKIKRKFPFAIAWRYWNNFKR